MNIFASSAPDCGPLISKPQNNTQPKSLERLKMNEICNKVSHRDRLQACKVYKVLWVSIKDSSQIAGAEEKLPS